MSQFVLNLFDATHEQRITGITSFVGKMPRAVLESSPIMHGS